MQSVKPPLAKLVLPSKPQPTPEQGELDELWNATESPVSSRGDLTTREKIWKGFKKAKLNLYSHEELQQGEIRLLILKPAQDTKDDIFVELRRHTFEEIPKLYEFAALSYHWGDGEDVKPVWVHTSQKEGWADIVDRARFSFPYDDITRKRLYVKPNLYKALQCLRHKTKDIALWVDAICINQSNESEKRSQVMKMAQLYASADQVCIWLGSADAEGRTNRAMDFIKEIVKEHDVQKLITPAKAPSWDALIYLLRSSWFSRRWVIQELALAKVAEVRCGDKAVHWRDFGDAISLFVIHFDQIRKLSQENKSFTESKTISEINSLGAKILVDEISNIFCRRADGSLNEPLQGLESLVSSLPSFDTSDPRDTVYALLNIAKETSSLSRISDTLAKSDNPPPTPSYAADLLEVYIAFVRWVIRDTKTLDIICRPWALPANKGNAKTNVTLPSWIKVAPESPHGKQQESYRGRKNGDGFVGLPGHKIYNASLDLPAKARLGEDLLYSSPPSRSNTGKSTPCANNAAATPIIVQPQPVRVPATVAHPSPPPSAHGIADGTPEVDIFAQSCSRQADASRLSSSNAENTKKRRLSQHVEAPMEKRRAMVPGGGVVATPPSERVDSPCRNLGRPSKNKWNSSLHVNGFQIGEVSWKTDPIPDGVIPSKALTELGWKRESGKSLTTVPDSVWRTLVADRGPDGKVPPHLYHRACLRCLVKGTPNGHINTKELLAADPPEPQRGFLKRVQAVTWNRVVLKARRCEGEEGDLVGIGPPATDLNDIVCILYGCSVPCILRGPEKTGEGEEFYRFVGEAFIYGEMDGEAVAGLSQEALDSKTKEFRLM